MARCKSCSAPLDGYKLKCDYCGTRNDIDLRGIHEYTTKVPESNRICPRCDIKLKTIDLKLDGPFYIEQCDQCQGMFFDPGELRALLDKTVTNVFSINHKKLAALRNEAGRRESIIQYIKCPECREFMNRVNFGAKSGVIVDRCRAHGVWLDGGELKRLMEWKKLGGQLLEERKHIEKAKAKQKEKERKSAEHAHYIAKAEQQSGGTGVHFYTSQSYDYDLFNLVSGIVGKFFR